MTCDNRRCQDEEGHVLVLLGGRAYDLISKVRAAVARGHVPVSVSRKHDTVLNAAVQSIVRDT